MLVAIMFSCNQNGQLDDMERQIIDAYPAVFKDSTVVDDYHGTKIEDPYRWLEDDHSDETKDWVTQQNDITFSFLDKIPFRDKLKDRLTELDELNADPKVVIDPNKFSEDGTTSLAGISFNKKGDKLAYLISEGGSDWRTAKFMDLKTNTVLKDEIKWIKFSGLSWSGDGVYYSRYPVEDEDDELSAKNENHSVYFHKIGTTQNDDALIFNQPDHPQRNIYSQTTEDERFLILSLSESTSGNAIRIRDLAKGDEPIKAIVDRFSDDYSIIDNEDDQLIVLTNFKAPNQRLIGIDVTNPAEANWTNIIPESALPLQSVSTAGDKLFAEYLEDANSLIKVYDRKGNFIQDLTLPGIGSASGISGTKESSVGFYSFTSFTYPRTIFKLDIETLESEAFREPSVDFNPDKYVTKQLWVTSYDGTKLPMFVTHKKDLVLDGSNPTLLYAYGGFNISVTPSFNPGRIPLLENGGVYAVANLRGGGEYGKEWHKAGTLEQKQNVFDDFQSAAEHLIKEKYTSSKKLAIEGGSNGGLLVGACMTQRPDLYAVAIPRVGVLDMLRYHEFTIGWAWAADYGRSDDPEAFDYLIKYSPLHNIKEVAYPATIVTTADHDDRVVPAHSFKFISELQDKHQGDNPVIIRVDTSAGHGAGKPTSKTIAEYADVISFMFYNMNEGMEFEVKG